MSKNVTSTSKKAVSFDYLKGREAVKIYLGSSNLARKDLHPVGTNAQVSGMRSLHADTSADLSKRERPQDVNFSY